jgi:hypothetical protein
MKRYSIRVTPVVALTFVACAPVSKPGQKSGVRPFRTGEQYEGVSKSLTVQTWITIPELDSIDLI